MTVEKLKQGIKDHMVEFLTKSANPPPLLFFTLYVYQRLDIQSADYVAYTFFTVGLIFSLVFRFNHFYIYSPVLNKGIGYLSVLNLLLGLLAANEKWKLYLFLFIIGDSITLQYTELTALYRICCCLYLGVDVYRNMIFGSIKDNVMFFTGFMTIFIYELFAKLIESVEGYEGIPYFTIPFSLIMSYKLIKSRIGRLKKQEISKLRNVELMSHYISLIKTEIESPYSREGFLQSHMQNCRDVQCFCRNSTILMAESQEENNQLGMKLKSKVEYYFLRSLYQKALQLRSIPKKQLLYNKFISFLIQNNQITQAIELYTRLQVLQAKFYYFRWVERVQLYSKIKNKLSEFEYFNPFSKEFLFVFQYDNSYLYLASQIKDILKLKVQFWRQVGKQNPKMVVLQTFGSSIVQKMYDLNNFYYRQIKQQQEKINNFNGTIVYAMYLLSTTNYKEFAQSLIKNTSRTLQSIKIHEDNIAETYGLRIVIRDTYKSCNERLQEIKTIISPNEIDQIAHDGEFHQLIYQKQERERRQKIASFYDSGFIQIITNISGSLCKLLKSSKNEIIGRDLNLIIPKSYQQRHHLKVGRVLHYDSHVNKQIVNLSFVNKIRQVPVKTADGKLITARVSVKIYEGFEEGVSFVAVVQTINENKVTVISDLQGNLEEFEEGLGSLKILQDEEVKKVIKQLKKQWNAQFTITTKKINLSYIDNNFSLTFSSPYQSSFLSLRQTSKDQIEEAFGESQEEGKKLLMKKQMESKVRDSPPLHIDVVNESIPYLSNLRQDREQEMSKCIKKMESVFYKTDIDSQSSTNSSRKSSVVNVLMSFSENYFIPFYAYIMVVFGLVLTCAMVVNVVGWTQLGLGWDNTIAIQNPIINLMSLMDMRTTLIEASSYQLELRQFNNNPLINKTNVNSMFGLNTTTFPSFVQQLSSRNEVRYKNAVSSVTMYMSDLLNEKFSAQIQSILIPTKNPNNLNSSKATQYLPLQNVFMNYLVDLDLLARGKPFQKTILYYNFWSTVQFIISQVDVVNEVISDSINKSVLWNSVFCAVVGLVFLFTIIPMYFLLKRRVKRHIDIYDLIVSVQGELVKSEIKKLDNIITIVNNSNESSEILKTNTINYLARKRSSAAVNDNIGANNEMIQGLVDAKSDSIEEDHAPDDVINEEEQSLQLQSENSGKFIKKPLTGESSTRLTPFFDQKHHDKMLGEEKEKLELRRRSGELDLTRSEGDFKRVVIKHWLLYVTIFLSVFTLLAITAIKIDNFKNLNSSYQRTVKEYATNIEQGLILYNAKLYFRGWVNVSTSYHNVTFIKWFNDKVYSDSIINASTPSKYSDPLPLCTGPTDVKYKYCQHNYSILTLRQEINHYVKQSYEMRQKLNAQYNLTNQNMSLVPQSQLKEFSEYFFYIQSLRGCIANTTRTYNQQFMNQTFANHTQLNSTLEIIFIIGLIYTVLALIFGLFLVNHMKKLYFKEIIIVSFLNNEMISKNKRVQSFLETLSKSSY